MLTKRILGGCVHFGCEATPVVTVDGDALCYEHGSELLDEEVGQCSICNRLFNIDEVPYAAWCPDCWADEQQSDEEKRRVHIDRQVVLNDERSGV